VSQWCLLQATAEHLRDKLTLSKDQCKVMADGMPPPMMGQFFLAVHQGAWRRDRHYDYSLGERFGVAVTLTWRVTRTPQDKWGTLELAAAIAGTGNQPGFIARLEQVRAAIHQSYELITRANRILGGTGVTVNGFDGGETMEFLDGGRAQRKDHNWLSARPLRGQKAIPAALAQEMTFGEALRIQAVLDGPK
jgi:hypothetical protein